MQRKALSGGPWDSEPGYVGRLLRRGRAYGVCRPPESTLTEPPKAVTSTKVPYLSMAGGRYGLRADVRDRGATNGPVGFTGLVLGRGRRGMLPGFTLSELVGFDPKPGREQVGKRISAVRGS